MPTNSTLSSSSQHSSEQSNTPALDTPTPILTWQVPETEAWEIPEGEPAIMEAETTADNSGPAGANADPAPGTKFGLAYRQKDSLLNQWTVFAQFIVDPFNTISISEQMDDRGSDRRTIEFDDRVISSDYESLTFEDGDEIALVTIGDDSIDSSALHFSYDRTVHNA